MTQLKEKIDANGRISIKKILNGTTIKAGDLVLVIPDSNKVVLKPISQKKSKNVFSRMAGSWANRSDAEIEKVLDRSDRRNQGLDY